jgi:hypothetical protein
MSNTKPPKEAVKALKELQRLEADAVKADAKAREVSGQLTRARAEHDEINRRRYLLLEDRPELETPTGAPAEAGNDLDLLEKQRAKIGDLNDLQAAYNHARKIENRCNQRITEYIAQHYPQLVDAFRPEAEAAAQQFAEAVETAKQAAYHYRGIKQRAEGLTGPVQGITTRVVPGDDVHEVIRVLDQVGELPPPIQDLDQPQAVAVFPSDFIRGEA